METTVRVPLEHAKAIKRLLKMFAEVCTEQSGFSSVYVGNYAAIMDECIADAIVLEPPNVPWTSGLPWGGNG